MHWGKSNHFHWILNTWRSLCSFKHELPLSFIWYEATAVICLTLPRMYVFKQGDGHSLFLLQLWGLLWVFLPLYSKVFNERSNREKPGTGAFLIPAPFLGTANSFAPGTFSSPAQLVLLVWPSLHQFGYCPGSVGGSLIPKWRSRESQSGLDRAERGTEPAVQSQSHFLLWGNPGSCKGRRMQFL